MQKANLILQIQRGSILREELHHTQVAMSGCPVQGTVSLLEKNVPYSRKYWRGITFGRLADSCHTANIKSANNNIIAPTMYTQTWRLYRNRQIYIRQLQFSSFFQQSAKYYSRQYIRLYGSTIWPVVALGYQ